MNDQIEPNVEPRRSGLQTLFHGLKLLSIIVGFIIFTASIFILPFATGFILVRPYPLEAKFGIMFLNLMAVLNVVVVRFILKSSSKPNKSNSKPDISIAKVIILPAIAGILLGLFLPEDNSVFYIAPLIVIAILLHSAFTEAAEATNLDESYSEAEKQVRIFLGIIGRKIPIALLLPTALAFTGPYPLTILDFDTMLAVISGSMVFICSHRDVIPLIEKSKLSEYKKRISVRALKILGKVSVAMTIVALTGFILSKFFAINLWLLVLLYIALATILAFPECLDLAFEVDMLFSNNLRRYYNLHMPDSKDPVDLMIKGASYLVSGQYKESEHYLTLAMNSIPDSSDNYLNRGYARYKLKKLGLAEEDFSKAIELEPQNNFAFILRAMTRDADDNEESTSKALEDIDRAIELAPDYYLRANIYLNENRIKECLDEIQKCMRCSGKYREPIGLPGRIILAREFSHAKINIYRLLAVAEWAKHKEKSRA